MTPRACPICRTTTDARYGDTPYWQCPTCDLLFQDPLPPKRFHGPHEAAPNAMSEGEKEANRYLAQFLFDKVLQGKPGPTLDIGVAYPMLAHALRGHGCTAYGMEPGDDVARWCDELGVLHLPYDFEADAASIEQLGYRFKLITCIHSYEHFYDPIAAFRRVRRLLDDDGRFFIRCPDHRTPGIGRDLTPGHFEIHPHVHTLTSILQACAETHAFTIVEQWPLQPGQRDIWLGAA